jgi:hypothetical protein
MKKFFILFAAVLLTAMSVNVFAQGTGTAPSIGSTHQYYVNGTYGSPIEAGETSTYTWWISTTPADLSVRTTLTADFDVTEGAYNSATLGSAGGTGIEIKWNPTASTTNHYYLVVQEEGVAPLCTNLKAVAILPTNNFKLLFEAIASDGTTLEDDPTRCPAPITLSATGATIAYNYGTDNFMFKLTAQDLYSSWSFVGTIAKTLTSPGFTVEYKIGEAGTFGAWTGEPNLTVPSNTAGTEVVYFRVNVDNGTSAGTYEENTAAKTITLTLSDVEDEGGNAVTEITNNNGDNITATPVQTQNIQARPATTSIGFN